MIPEFLQRILENVYRGQYQVQFKQSFEPWFFIEKQVNFLLQKQIFIPLNSLIFPIFFGIFKHKHNIFRADIGLNGMNRCQYISATRSEIVNSLFYFVLDFLFGSIGEYFSGCQSHPKSRDPYQIRALSTWNPYFLLIPEV